MLPKQTPDRLPSHPTQEIDRSVSVTFNFNGRTVHAYSGDTLASALYSSGVRIYTRSFKYHRPRGLLCSAGRCPNCMMTVNGIPNVRTCSVLVEEGMVVKQQNAWPSTEHDLFSILDRMDRFLPVGFYYKIFHRPKQLWNIVGPIVRRMAGLGYVQTRVVEENNYSHETRHVDVLVVGGGASGMSAALSASRRGKQVMLVDDQQLLGGRLRFDGNLYDGIPGVTSDVGYEIADNLSKLVTRNRNIEVMLGTTAFGLYEGNLIGLIQGRSKVKLRSGKVILATGIYEQPSIFDRNDLPGVMLSTAIQRLIHLKGIIPGRSAVVSTCDDQGYRSALDMLKAGIRIVAIIDSRERFPNELLAARELQENGVLVLMSHMLIRAEGTKHVVGAAASRLSDGHATTEEREFDCDLIAMSGGFQPADSLLRQAGCELSYNKSIDRMVASPMPDKLYAVGRVIGNDNLGKSIVHARSVGSGVAEVKSADNALSTPANFMHESQDLTEIKNCTAPSPIDLSQGAKQFVCFCEDVTARDIVRGIDEGFEDIETLKRYTTSTMGPCQGKMCHKHFANIRAKSLDNVDSAVYTTARPPVTPIPLGALAAQVHTPIKRTPLDRKHRELGAKMIELGPWYRPHTYTSSSNECLSVRNTVGIIDVSTLGKLEVVGQDAKTLLDKVYTGNFSTLKKGQIRYGILCSEDGTILDDGTVTRISEDRYFVTTTTGNIDVIEEWFKWWTVGTGLCAHITNVTSSYASINVAGPMARDTLRKLTKIDLSSDSFRYMWSRRGMVAGVQTLFLRIGFVGETGWELHFPAEYAEHMWESIMDAGKEYQITPFGVEAQRILRLEKKHLIVNQDTDAVSTPLSGDMAWAVKFDKDDFIGRSSLISARDSGYSEKLIGFNMKGSEVPEDGSPIVSENLPVGRVTSSRRSPITGQGFGLVWVPADMAEEGKVVHVRVGGENLPAELTFIPAYDPDGIKLRE